MKPTKRPVKLTTQMLKSIVEAEVKNVGFDPGGGSVEDRKDPKEFDADELADSLDDAEDHQPKEPKSKAAGSLDEHMAYMKALKIEESRLTRRLLQVKSALNRGVKKLVVAKIV